MPATYVGLQRDPVTGRITSVTHTRNTTPTNITVVAGPPAGGKTTYVREHRQPTDIVIDLDAIHEAIGSSVEHGHHPSFLPFALDARDALIDRALSDNNASHVWIIRGAPLAEDRHIAPGVNVIVIATPLDEALNRARTAGRPPLWDKLIHDWWATYQPHPDDTVLNG
jgi:hypothetical protein